jgi:hypothetical protein
MNGWISVKIRLPEEGVAVLAKSRRRDEYVACIEGRRWRCWEGCPDCDTDIHDHETTHWKPVAPTGRRVTAVADL